MSTPADPLIDAMEGRAQAHLALYVASECEDQLFGPDEQGAYDCGVAAGIAAALEELEERGLLPDLDGSP